jgi:hypothetical protein
LPQGQQVQLELYVPQGQLELYVPQGQQVPQQRSQT